MQFLTSWNHERNFLDPFPTRRCILRGRGCAFEEMERRESAARRGEAARRRVGRSGPHSRGRAHIGPFRRNAERAAICSAMKIKHRIVPISSFPEVLHVPEARERTWVGRDTPALLRLWPFTWNSVRWESGFDKDIRELTDFFYRSLLNPPRCVHIVLKHSACDDCTNLQGYSVIGLMVLMFMTETFNFDRRAYINDNNYDISRNDDVSPQRRLLMDVLH